ncbi:YkvA family protein [Methylocaldum gracile]|uniref:YkvA family protein n=1 Tax=unclassified Methylocaldum TaxID=2622260 RepID=UPI0010D0B335
MDEEDRNELNEAFFKRNGGKITDRHFDRIIEKAREIENKAKKIPALYQVWLDILLCLELIRDYRSGTYRDIAAWAIAAVAFGLLYLINPAELIPDVIPIVGYLDDVAVMALILKLVKVELEKYAAWRKARDEYQEALSRLFADE